MPVTDVLFRGIDSSPTVEALVRKWALRLDHVYDRLQRCEVVIEVPHRHHARGRTFHVRVVLTVPGRSLAVSGASGTRASVHVAVRDAFRAARRQLEDHARLERGDVKVHAKAS